MGWVNSILKAEWRAPSPGDVMPMIPLSFVKDGVRLSYFSMITTVGTPQTVTAEELRLECMFPADELTEAGQPVHRGAFVARHGAALIILAAIQNVFIRSRPCRSLVAGGHG